MKGKIIVVTGANGFLGRYVASHCAGSGAYVIGLGHGCWSQSEWREWGLREWHQADVSLDALLLYAKKPDILIHCAGGGSVGFSMEYPQLDFRRTVESTSEVLEFLRLHAPHSRLVYPSSAAVFGVALEAAISEKTPTAPVSPYGVHKLMAEDLCRLYGNKYDISISIVRLFSIYGKELRKQLLWDACGKIRAGKLQFSGTGNESRDWVHVTDAARLLYKSAQQCNTLCPVACGGSGIGVTVREIVEELAFVLSGERLEPQFTGHSRPGDPVHLVAAPDVANEWDSDVKTCWKKGIKEYALWYQSQI